MMVFWMLAWPTQSSTCSTVKPLAWVGRRNTAGQRTGLPFNRGSERANAFRRVAAVVHHGGPGTTTAAAQAGAPQVVVPQMYDQHYWAKRVYDLGIGTAHAPNAPTADSLTEALSHTLQPDVAARARAVAASVRTDGAEIAARRLIDEVSRGALGNEFPHVGRPPLEGINAKCVVWITRVRNPSASPNLAVSVTSGASGAIGSRLTKHYEVIFKSRIRIFSESACERIPCSAMSMLHQPARDLPRRPSVYQHRPAQPAVPRRETALRKQPPQVGT
jgi:Glycosyltransferase family 28 C-terminal domain